MTPGEQLAKAVIFSPDYPLSDFEKDWEWEVKFSDLARAFDTAIAAERDRCLRAVSDCPSLDENGYICEKGHAMKAIILGSAVT